MIKVNDHNERLFNPLIKKFVVLELLRPSKFTFGEALTAPDLNLELIIYFFSHNFVFCISIFLLFMFLCLGAQKCDEP